MAKKENNQNPQEKQGFIKRMFFKYKEVIIYIIVGGITTLVRWGTTPIFESILKPLGFIDGALSFFTTLVSLVVTVLFAFVPNKLYVFESKSFDKSIVLKEFVAFLSARAVASIIELAFIPLIAYIFKCSTIIPTILVSIVVLILNYVFSKLVIFKKRVPAQDDIVSEKKAEKIEKSRNRRDKVIAVITTSICAVVAIIAIVSCAVLFFNFILELFNK